MRARILRDPVLALSTVWRFSPAFCIHKNFPSSVRIEALLLRSIKFCVSWARDEMIVHHSDSLHQRVTNGRTDKFKSAPREVEAHCIGFRCARRHLTHLAPPILLRLAADKTPKISVKAPELLSNHENCFRILDGRSNLEPVSHDPGVAKKAFHIARTIPCDFLCPESIKRLSIVLSFVKNRSPTQACLRAFENQKLKELAVVVHWHAPFFIMISEVWFANRPGTARHAA